MTAEPRDDLHRLVEEIVMAPGWREALRAAVAAADRENAELRGLLSRVASPAVRYDQRVYHLTDDFAALTPFLSEDDIAAAGERPSETDARVKRERDDLRAQLAAAQAQLAEARSWVAKTEPYPDLNGNKLAGLRAVLSAAPQPEPEPCPYATFGGELYLDNLRRVGPTKRTIEAAEAACTCGKHRLAPEPPASGEPARCEHGRDEEHLIWDDGIPIRRCHGPAASPR